MAHSQESGTVEFKRQLTDAAKRAIIAFANSEGGDLYLGIDDDGTPVGVDDPDGVMGAVGDMIRNAISPDLTAYTTIECEPTATPSGGVRPVVHVTVLRGTKRPYYLTSKGLKPTGVFVRHGVSSVPAGEERIRRMIRDDDGTVFDTARCADQELTFDYAEQVFRRRQVPWDQAKQRSLGLRTADGPYTNAALLLSDQCQHVIKGAVYQGRSKARSLDRCTFAGSVLLQLDEACRYLELNNPVSSQLTGLYRDDHHAYPPEALREALVNAVVHRDYDYSGPTLVSFFDDRVEFVSLGGLVKGMTLADVTSGVSQPRNRILAEVCYRLSLTEGYGNGLPRILDAYAGNSTPPTIRITPGSFTLCLPRLDGADGGTAQTAPAPGPVTTPGDGADGDRHAIRQPFPDGTPIRRYGDMQIASLSGHPTGERIGVAQLTPAAGTGLTTFTDGSCIETVALGAGTPADEGAVQPSSTLEALTLAYLRQRGGEASRLDVQRHLGVNKNRAAYVLRKLERDGSVIASGSARSTRYAAA